LVSRQLGRTREKGRSERLPPPVAAGEPTRILE
jgi:hypothetical protein